MADDLRAIGVEMSKRAAECAKTIASQCQCAIVIMLDPSGVTGVGISGNASRGDLHAVLESLVYGFELETITPTEKGRVIEIDREGRRK